MKRTLALILMLVLVAFAFASCGKKTADATTAAKTTAPTTAAPTGSSTTAAPTQPEATEPEETEPECNHVPEDEWVVLTPATCTTTGLEKLYCLECGAEIDERTIPVNPDAHSIPDSAWEIVEPTIFADGSKHGVCTLCNTAVDEVIEETYTEWKYTTETIEARGIKANPSTLRGEGHYYPDDVNVEGQDYIVEFTFLWNDSLKKLSKKNAAGEDNKLHQVLTGGMHSKAFFWMALKDGAKGADSGLCGAFEYTDCVQTVEVGPAGMSPDASGNITGGVYANFPNIGGADKDNPEWGWHRLAFVYHEELANEDALKADTEAGATAPDYRVEYSCYIDGTLIYKCSNRPDANFHASDNNALYNGNLLFTAASNGDGTITYVDTDKSAFDAVQLKPVRTDEGEAYAVIADFKAHVEPASSDPAFVQNVKKVASPADNVYTTEDSVEIPAKIWFELDAD